MQPCQSLFVAPCSHVWHYKCIRPILNGPTWPNFLCPNCRAVADLEEDVDDPDDLEDWEADAAETNGDAVNQDHQLTPRASPPPLNGTHDASSSSNDETSNTGNLVELQQAISNINISESLQNIANEPIPDPQTPHPRATASSSSSSFSNSQPLPINVAGANEFSGLTPMFANTMDGLTPGGTHDGPMTPRNDAGPFVLDGSAGRAAGSRLREEALSSESGSDDAETPNSPPTRFG